MLAKGIKFYVGKFELSDMKISLRLTIKDNRNGTLNISKWIKSKGKKWLTRQSPWRSNQTPTIPDRKRTECPLPHAVGF